MEVLWRRSSCISATEQTKTPKHDRNEKRKRPGFTTSHAHLPVLSTIVIDIQCGWTQQHAADEHNLMISGFRRAKLFLRHQLIHGVWRWPVEVVVMLQVHVACDGEHEARKYKIGVRAMLAVYNRERRVQFQAAHELLSLDASREGQLHSRRIVLKLFTKLLLYADCHAREHMMRDKC